MYVGKQGFFHCQSRSEGVEIDSCEQKVWSRGKLTAVQKKNLEITITSKFSYLSSFSLWVCVWKSTVVSKKLELAEN